MTLTLGLDIIVLYSNKNNNKHNDEKSPTKKSRLISCCVVLCAVPTWDSFQIRYTIAPGMTVQ